MRRHEHHPWYIWRQTPGAESQDLLSRPIAPSLLVPSTTRPIHRLLPKPTRTFGPSASTVHSKHTTYTIIHDAPKTELPALPEPCSIPDLPDLVANTSIRPSERTPECLCLVRIHRTPALHPARVTSGQVQGCTRPTTNIHRPTLISHHCHVLAARATQCMLWHPTAYARFKVLPHEH